jgi:hypothetical protein
MLDTALPTQNSVEDSMTPHPPSMEKVKVACPDVPQLAGLRLAFVPLPDVLPEKRWVGETVQLTVLPAGAFCKVKVLVEQR